MHGHALDEIVAGGQGRKAADVVWYAATIVLMLAVALLMATALLWHRSLPQADSGALPQAASSGSVFMNSAPGQV